MPPKRAKAPSAPLASTPPPASAPAPVPPAEPLVTLPYPRGAWRALAYALAFLQPAMGLVLALLYWPGQDPRVRRFSRWCLALAVLGWFIASGSDAVRSGAQSGEWFIQPY